MGTRTKNLGLYKPAPTDYVNVETDLNENFEKIDEKVLTRGTYQGNAQDLKDEIDEKYDESTYITVGNNSTNSIYLFDGDIDKTPKAGFYYYGSGSQNLPFGKPGGLLYLPWKENQKFAKQLFIPDHAPYLLVRDMESTVSGNWEKIITETNIYKQIGGLSTINYIQDNLEKEKNKGYIDKETGKLYRAKENTQDTSVTSNFELVNIVSNSLKGIGYEQKYRNYNYGTDRKCNTQYINDTNKPIVVYVNSKQSYDGGTVTAVVDEIEITSFNSILHQGAIFNLSFIVPVNSKYKINDTDGNTISRWVELR